MEQSVIIDRLRTVMKRCTTQAVDWDSIGGGTPVQSLGFDSLAILDLIYEIQQEFGIEVEAEAFAGVKTVADVVDLLTRRGI
jgi:acyl carrier protein